MRFAIAIALCVALGAVGHYARDRIHTPPPQRAPGQVLTLVLGAPGAQQHALDWLRANYRAGDIPMLLEALPRIPSPALREQIVALMQAKTGQHFGSDLSAWYRWLWAQPDQDPPGYAAFTGALYAGVDPRFVSYFDNQPKTAIRLDEIRWGGVGQNGIPPLRKPAMVNAGDAHYLADDNVVFGLDINGDARAYPKRIMGHHELFTDTVGGVAVAGVYCTLCGSMIVYESKDYKLGTSGFLFRSNKLMFDAKTNSLWSTLWGRPVVGPLVGKGIDLKRRPVVTSTWGEWRRNHPQTQVLDIHTGYDRNYAEGAAYHDYFATDKLMFTVPQQALHGPLKNKQPVLALRQGGDALAIDTAFLDDHPVYQNRLDGKRIVVLTNAGEANRVYAADDVHFKTRPSDHSVRDAKGMTWQVTEDALVSADGRHLARIPAHRAFWFGWKAAFEKTRLVH